VDFRSAGSSATEPASRAAAATYESARGHTTVTSRHDAWMVCLNGAFLQMKPWRWKPHSCNDVEHKGSNQAADRFRFVLLRCRVSDCMMKVERWKANPHYVVMRLPEKKPTQTACSSWTSPELGLPRMVAWRWDACLRSHLASAASTKSLFWRQSVGDSAERYRPAHQVRLQTDTIRCYRGHPRGRVCSLLKPSRQDTILNWWTGLNPLYVWKVTQLLHYSPPVKRRGV